MPATASTVAEPSAARPRAVTRRLAALERRPVVVVTLIVVLSAALVAAFSVRITGYEPDELGYTHLAIGIADQLRPFTRAYGGSSRLNQLYPLLIAPWWGLFGNVLAFRVSHAWNALLMASAVIPTYLLARQVMRERWAAYGAALLVALVPWLAIATAQLTEVAAWPACAWALLAMQCCIARPSWRRDLVAMAAIALASYGRLQLVVLGPILVVAVLLHDLGMPLTGGRPTLADMRGAAWQMARGHALLSVVTVLGLVIGIPLLVTGVLASAAGFYGDTLAGVAIGPATFDFARTFLTGISLGLGGVTVALTIGFIFSALATPVSRSAHAFASLSLVAIVGLTFQVAEVTIGARLEVMQERYLFYIVPLFAVGMFAAVLAARRRSLAVLGGSLLLAALIATTHYETSRTAFWYQTSPGITNFFGWVAPAFGASASPTAPADNSAFLPAGIAIVAIGAVLAALLRWVRAQRVLAGLACVVIVFCGAETVHSLVDVVNGAPGSGGLGGGNLHDVDWVDAHVPSGASVTQIVDNQGGRAVSAQLWNDNVFWNRTVNASVTRGHFIWPVYLGPGGLSLNRASGRLTSGGAPLTQDYAVVATRRAQVFPMGTVVSRSPGDALELVRLARPVRASYAVSGTSSGGWLSVGHPGHVTLYGLHACVPVTLTFSLPPVASSRETVRVGRGAPLTVRPGRTASAPERVCPHAGGAGRIGFVDEAPRRTAGDVIPVRLSRIEVRR